MAIKGCRGGVSWLVGSQKRVKDLVGEDSRFIVELVTVSVFCVSAEASFSLYAFYEQIKTPTKTS
jgi:hypothetical protein